MTHRVSKLSSPGGRITMKPPGGKKLKSYKKDGCQKFIQILVHNDHRGAGVHNQEEALRDEINTKTE